ncbi:MAG: flavodoxin family protein [Promethearchaeota archaeon]
MKVLITYDTKYGNTEKVANLIGDGITSIEGNEVIVNNVKDVKLKQDDSYDLILIGSPVHFGSHVGSVKKFIKKLPNSQLKAKAYAVFNTYMGEPTEEGKEEGGICSYQKMLNKMEKQISETMPDLTKASQGLYIKVDGMKGPITEEDIPKCKEFGIKLTN